MQVLTPISLLQNLYERSGVDWIASSYNDSEEFYHYDRDKLIGYCLLIYNDTISNLVVDTNYRNSGIASSLIRQAISRGGKYLCSLKNNVKFYINRGFKVYCVQYCTEYKENIYYMRIN